MDKEKKAQIKYYLDHGLGATEISRILHISRQSVYNYKKKHPVDKRVLTRAIHFVYNRIIIK